MFKIRLKELRENKGMNQREFAADFGVSAGTIGMWESGAREPKTLEDLQRIADYFGVSVDYLLGRDDNKKAPTTEGERITMDDFTYAMQNETKDLTDMDKQILLSMAKQLNDARKQKNGEAG